MSQLAHTASPGGTPWGKSGKDVSGGGPEQEHYFRQLQEAESQARLSPEQEKDKLSQLRSVGGGGGGGEKEGLVPGRKSVETDQITNNIPEEELSPDDAVDSAASKVGGAVDGVEDGVHGVHSVDGLDGLDGHHLNDVDGKTPTVDADVGVDADVDVDADIHGVDVDVDEHHPLEETEEGVGVDLPEEEGEGVSRGLPSEIGSKAASALPSVLKSKVGGESVKAPSEAAGICELKQKQLEELEPQPMSEVGEGEKVLGETSSKVGDVVEGAESKVGETTSQAGGVGEPAIEGAEPKAADVVEGAEAKAGDVTEKVGKEGEKAAEGAVEEAVEDKVDVSILKGGKVNKGGNIVNEDGKVIGRVVEGVLAHMVGKRVDEAGAIWNDSGAVVGRAEPIPKDELESLLREAGPFEAFPDAVVDSKGMVVSGGEEIGKVVEGDIKKLRGMSVDPDGDILDRGGNVVGKAERWEPEPEPEPEPEVEVDRSILAGKRVNKAGNVVDGAGVIFGRVVEGDPKRMVGRMCDKKGNILSESGDVIGRAEVVAEGEREGLKEGPFAELSGCTVTKDGKVVTPGGDVVGRLVSGDPKILFGRLVDEDGDVCDKNGNVLGKAERWEEPVVEKKKNALSGRRVNREGNVVDEDGNLVGKLTSGQLSICSGKEIDDDGDVVDSKGNTIGHVSLLEDIPPEVVEEEVESAEDREKRELSEKDKELAKRMSMCLTQVLDKIKPICDMITRKIEAADRVPKEELDEEELVKEVRPLIEEGGRILQEAHGIIKGLDPDGRIQANAKHKTATREASPEEYQLADILKELTGTVAKCIDDAKKRLEGMPHAEKELSPLWGLLSEPLFQILAAVGLLLNGVLGLVGRLLSGLGLGGLVDSILGGLGVKQILESLGIGSLTDSLTGKNQKKKKSGGGLLGLGVV